MQQTTAESDDNLSGISILEGEKIDNWYEASALTRFLKEATEFESVVCCNILVATLELNKLTFHINAMTINSLAPCESFHAFLSSADYFQNQLFRKILSGIPSECQTD